LTERPTSNSVGLQLEAWVCDVPFGLSFVSPHRPSHNTARTKILDRTPYRNRQQLDRLCHCIANITAWLYSRKPVLHLRIRVQHAVVAQETNTHKSRSDAATGEWFGRGRRSAEPCYATSYRCCESPRRHPGLKRNCREPLSDKSRGPQWGPYLDEDSFRQVSSPPLISFEAPYHEQQEPGSQGEQ
jgi:hypothetical protein